MLVVGVIGGCYEGSFGMKCKVFIISVIVVCCCVGLVIWWFCVVLMRCGVLLWCMVCWVGVGCCVNGGWVGVWGWC